MSRHHGLNYMNPPYSLLDVHYVHMLIFLSETLVQYRAARFIKQDYRPRRPGCIIAVLKDLELPLSGLKKKTPVTHLYDV